MKLGALAFVLGGLVVFASSLIAADGTWQGGGTNPASWADASNWVGGVVPGSSTANTDTATFPGGVTAGITQGVPQHLGRIIVSSTANVSITLSLNLSVAGVSGTSLNIAGNLNLSGFSTLTCGAAVIAASGGGAATPGGQIASTGLNIAFNGGLQVGLGATTTTQAGDVSISNGSITMGSAAILQAGPFSDTFFSGCTISSTFAWTFTTAATANRVELRGCSVGSTSTGNLTLTLGGGSGAGPGLILVGCSFFNYTAVGLSIPAGSRVTDLRNCQFSLGISSGAHITVAGLSNATVNCDNNVFDSSTGMPNGLSLPATLGPANAGLLVDTNGSSPNPLRFRCSSLTDFGVGVTYAIREVQGENDDADGTNQATNITWFETAPALTLAKLAGQPSSMMTSTSTPNQVALRFSLSATGATATVTTLRLTLQTTGTLLASHVSGVLLYSDFDSDGVMDTGEQIAISTAGVGTGTIDLTMTTPQAISTALPQAWTVSLTFGTAGGAGNLTISVPDGGVGQSSSAIILGPAFSHTLPVTGPPAQLFVLTQPNGAAAGRPFTTPVEVEVRDAAGNRVFSDNSTQVTAALTTNPTGATLSGTNPQTANSGIVVFGDLEISDQGTGYVLTFTATGVTQASTALFNVAAAPKKKSDKKEEDSGCSTGSESSMFWLAAMAAALLITVRPGRRQKQ